MKKDHHGKMLIVVYGAIEHYYIIYLHMFICTCICICAVEVYCSNNGTCSYSCMYILFQLCTNLNFIYVLYVNLRPVEPTPGVELTYVHICMCLCQLRNLKNLS